VGRLQPWGVVFGAASVLTPAFLGAAAAAVASGAIRVSGGRVTSGPFDGWTTPLALDFALLAVSICAYLAATYLMVETQDEPDLQADFRRRAVGAGLASGAFALLGLVIAWFTARPLVDELLGRGLPLLALALLNGPVALVAVLRGHPRVARRAVIGQIVLVLWAWGVGQYPALVPPDLTVRGTAAPDATISLMLVVVAAGMAVLLPSLYLLFRVFKGRAPV